MPSASYGRHELLDRDGFDQVGHEVVRVAAATIMLLSITRQGDESATSQPLLRTEPFGRVLTLASVAIHTGRTHQIRVHLSAIGHPIVGDSLYGGVHRRVPGDLRAVSRLERPFLHAARLAFTHPLDGRRMEFTSPLPDDLQHVLDQLREQHARIAEHT